MTKLILFTELLEVGTQLLEAGITGANVYEARKQLDYIFEKFEENEDFSTCEITTVLDEIAITALSIPKELKDYFRIIERFQTENEICLLELPHQHTMEQAQLMAGFFTILEDLLSTRMTPCDANETHIRLYEMFKAFEDEAEERETVEVDETLCHFFPNLETMLDGITILQGVQR